MQAASVAHRHGSVPFLCVLHALTGIVHAARAEAPAPFRFPARTIASHNTMSAKGMGDKRPAAIASVGDAASGAKAAMRTPYGRLRNRARTRTVRPPRPVRCAIRARVARRTAAARPARKPPPIPRRGADPGPVCLPREKMRGARFCAVAFLSGVPMPQPGLHAPCVRVPAWPPNTATAQFARHIRSQMAIIRHEICDPAAQGKALSSAEPHPHYTQTIR